MAKPIPGVVEAFYDPLGSFDMGVFGGPIGKHDNHVHISNTNPKTMLFLIRVAQRMGLDVRENPYTENVDPVHTTGSFHYRMFPGTYGGKQLGQAIDVSGDPDKMASFYTFAVTGGSKVKNMDVEPQVESAPVTATPDRPEPTYAETAPRQFGPPTVPTVTPPTARSATLYSPAYDDANSRMIQDVWRTIASYEDASPESRRFSSLT